MSEQQKALMRPLRVTGEAAWRSLWTGCLDCCEARVEDAVHRGIFARLLGDDPRDFNGLLAEVDRRPVGLAQYLLHRHGWKIEDVCSLQDLYVDPAMRGTGIGRRLIEAVRAAADRAGAPAVCWLMQEFSAAGRRLCDWVGRLTPFLKDRRP